MFPPVAADAPTSAPVLPASVPWHPIVICPDSIALAGKTPKISCCLAARQSATRLRPGPKEGRGEGRTTKPKNGGFDPGADRNVKGGTPWEAGGDMDKADQFTKEFMGGVPDKKQTVNSSDLPDGGITRTIPPDYGSDFTMKSGPDSPADSSGGTSPGTCKDGSSGKSDGASSTGIEVEEVETPPPGKKRDIERFIGTSS